MYEYAKEHHTVFYGLRVYFDFVFERKLFFSGSLVTPTSLLGHLKGTALSCCSRRGRDDEEAENH